ncbi:hypothetical protein BASA50_006118 [Batrachochytrium salamandrivorans]|uniref:Uncharacterized protein n=1 Tax=Batrachochytrium salamandrivorans TaxID=1357716 RepID=A0ABQ8FE73_9FUNG|nr:hypothetical protein BASA50_006118 [Batrachochytrium salamandrivorans]
MRLSTGIILSILSANVFAIEHPNDVHSSSLLARRAVMADTDGVFLQKRGDDEGKKKRPNQNIFLFLTLAKGGMSTQNLPLRMIPIQNPTLAMAMKRIPQTSLPISSIRMVGLRVEVKVSTQQVDSDQEESGFVDVIGGLPYQLIKYFKNKFNRGTSNPD